MKPSRALGALLCAVVLSPSAAHSDSKNVQATLVPEVSSIAPGQPFYVGLRLQMAPQWHTYWKNPGDSGLPTKIRWTLPPGFTAEPLAFPHPQRIALGPLVSYGYEGEVLLLSRINPPSQLEPGSAVRLAARVDWLECKEACLPGRAELEATLPMGSTAASRPEAEALFARARGALPQPPVGWAVAASADGGALVLAWPVTPGPASEGAYFFPETRQLVAYGAAQDATRDGSTHRLRVPRDENAAATDRITGVLVLGRGDEARAIAVDLPSPRFPAVSTAVPGAGPAAISAPPSGSPAAAGSPSLSGLPSVTTAMGGAVATLGASLLFAFVGGLLLNLMPCVLPVLSLKVLGFVKHASTEGRGAWRHGASFTAGVLVCFWLLAGALLLLRAAGSQVGWGFQLQSPGFVAALACLFCLLALNLLGVFEVGGSLVAAGGYAHRHRGLQGSFWSGALATVVATPCTAPFMGSALGFGLSQSPAVAFAVFTALGLGMAAPYALLASVPRLLRYVPRPGPWMETFKQLMGFLLFATVVALVWVFGRQTSTDAVAVLLAALLVVSLGGWSYGRLTRPEGPPRRRALHAVPAALVVLGFALGLAPARGGSSAGEVGGSDGFMVFSQERVLALRAEGRPVFVDFTAAWCLTCQVNERLVLAAPEVKARFRKKGVVLLKADWTLKDEAITAALASHGRQGVPLYVLYGRDPLRGPEILPEVLTVDMVLAALDRMP